MSPMRARTTIALALAGVLAAQDRSITKVARSFDLYSNVVGSVVRDVHVEGNRLHFLLSAGDATDIITTDRSGAVLARHRLAGRFQFLTSVSDGRILVARNRSDGKHVLLPVRADTNTDTDAEVVLPRVLNGLAFLNGRLHGFGSDGVWSYAPDLTSTTVTSGQAAMPYGDPSLATVLSNSAIAIVTVMRQPQIIVIGAGGGVRPPVSLSSPVLNRRLPLLEPDEGSIGLIGADVERQRLYCVVSGFKQSDGMTIEEFDAVGQHVESHILELPRFKELSTKPGGRDVPTNPNGFFAPGLLRASRGEIFLIHRRPGKVLVYRLSDSHWR